MIKMFNNLFNKKKEVSFVLSDEEKLNLITIEKNAYIEESRKYLEERGKDKAKKQFSVKKEVIPDKW